jgi:choline dehydrogenase-like flavoprotein
MTTEQDRFGWIRTDDPPAAADAVIIGGGMAGLAVAAEAEQRGLGCVVIDAGPADDLRHYRAAYDEPDALRVWLNPESDQHCWRPWTSSGLSYTGVSALRRRVGGRSLYWHGVTLPMDAWALESPAWPRAVVHDLTVSWDGGAPLYSRLDRELAVWAKGPGASTLGGARDVCFGDYEFCQAPLAVRRYTQDPARWEAYSPVEFWRGRPTGSARTVLVPSTRALGLLLTGDRVSGVRVQTGSSVRTIAAQRVVMAAGTIENSRLAIQALADSGQSAEPSLAGLADKVAYGFTAAIAMGALPTDFAQAASRGAFCFRACEPWLRSNMFLSMYCNASGVAVLDVWLLGEQSGDPAGQLRCDASAPWPWPVRLDAVLGDDDRRLAALQQAELNRVWNQFVQVAGLSYRPLRFPPGHGSANLPDVLLGPRSATAAAEPVTYSFPLGSEQHESGTTPFGRVLADDHQFHALRGVFAAGPSAFPRAGAANPTMTILALGRRLGALLGV